MGLRFFPRFSRLVLLVCVFACTVGVCVAPQPPPEPGLKDREAIATEYIREKLPLWQERLQLQDWKVTVLPVHPSNLRQRTLGNIHWDMDKKTAVIRVMDAADYQMPLRATLNDIEFTIVHELIHLELASLPRSEASRSQEEYAINHLADALLQSSDSSRGTRPQPTTR